MDAHDRELMSTLGVIGPPTMIFYDEADEELRGLRLVGDLDGEDFAAHLQRALNQ